MHEQSLKQSLAADESSSQVKSERGLECAQCLGGVGVVGARRWNLAAKAPGLEGQQGNDTICGAKLQLKLSLLALKPGGRLLEGVGKPLAVESPAGWLRGEAWRAQDGAGRQKPSPVLGRPGGRLKGMLEAEEGITRRRKDGDGKNGGKGFLTSRGQGV